MKQLRDSFDLPLTCMGGAVALISLVGLSSPVQAKFEDSPKAVLDEAWQIVNRDYVDETFNQTDWQASRQRLLSRSYTSNQQAYEALRQELKQLNDPYTRFLDPEQYRALTSQTSGELSGVGVRLGIDAESKMLTVIEPVIGSPASVAGIEAGDRIVAIDGKSTRGMTVEQASKLIQGEVGAPITLRIERNGQAAMNLSMKRARIELSNVNYGLRQEANARIGYIRLTEFSNHAPEQVRNAMKELLKQNVEGFVLDLRGNPGGLLQASIEISRLWLDSGFIVQTIDRVGESQEIKANQTALTQLPLAVLVDGGSASSSEILTGALRDNRRAVIVGSQTFGKALVQSVNPLSDGSGLAVTIAHYYTPDGTDISHLGITPDIEINLTEPQRRRLVSNQALIATDSDPQYLQAVNALRAPIALNRRGAAQSSLQVETGGTRSN
ncbi:MAG: S41 family peptidase [Pegethrix bostrychoides GSE-TBD4-15B]|jgi:carboxyl-terminal processing protease|uniref:Carboxyl-terminal-processing protease n=1 Tax=Pegethrix bostrychoides GSE-TBD4-15B TaxID=2839662 RepID=A0A951PEN9_9CYAN|nr:S41 family peptidase [Pegethrix bostrychoides GSE-TBD4-15B]